MSTSATRMERMDAFMFRLLRVTPEPPPATGQQAADSSRKARNAFDLSLMFSGIRCILQYVVLPFILPAIGLTGEFAVHITFAINIAAIIAIVTSLRRFWRTQYKGRWRYLAVAGPALAILLAFMVLDIGAMVG